MKDQVSARTKRECSAGSNIWFYVGGIALAVAVAGLITQFQDIKRYVKMVRM